jgi:hypothetical protein
MDPTSRRVSISTRSARFWRAYSRARSSTGWQRETDRRQERDAGRGGCSAHSRRHDGNLIRTATSEQLGVVAYRYPQRGVQDWPAGMPASRA